MINLMATCIVVVYQELFSVYLLQNDTNSGLRGKWPFKTVVMQCLLFVLSMCVSCTVKMQHFNSLYSGKKFSPISGGESILNIG